MTARWQKNASNPAQRTCHLLVYKSGALCPPSEDFIALGYVFVLGANSPSVDLATGTLTNDRRALVVADTVFTADNATEIFTAVAHGLLTGDGPVRASNSGGGLPAGLVAATDYWIIYIDDDTFYLATSLANAYAGTHLAITTNGTGVQTLSDTADTERGMPGHFTYVAPQVETVHDLAEMIVAVDGPVGSEYERRNQDGGYTSIEMGSELEMWNQILENGLSAADFMRLIVRTHVANFSDVGSTRTFRDLANTKNSHHATITSAGRSGSTIDDAT